MVTICAVTILLLAGCSMSAETAQPQAAQKTATPVPSPTPTIDPGPVVLTKEEAAERYLGLVCQRNVLVFGLNDAFKAQEKTYLNGGSGDVTEVKALSAEALRVNRLAIELIDDPYYTWPSGIDQHLQTIRQSYMSLFSYYDSLANAKSFEDAYYLTAEQGNGATAAQEIRYQLGLPADTSASCKGKETATDLLHAEMIERNEYLATFSEEKPA